MSESTGESGQSGGVGLHGGLNKLERALTNLDEGKQLDPIDSVTANRESKWRGAEPPYHDLHMLSYAKYDVSEWTGRAKKYKLELVQQGDRVRRLEVDVKVLKNKLVEQSSEMERTNREVDEVYTEIAQNQKLLEDRARKKQKTDSENVTLRRHLEEGRKAIERIKKQTGHFCQRMRALEAEADMSKSRYESCLGEKEKLRLEREWFFRERILLEETTKREQKHAAWDDELKIRLAKLRHAMHRAWIDAKRDDVRGHLRAGRWGPLREEWYMARRRMYEPISARPQLMSALSKSGASLFSGATQLRSSDSHWSQTV